MPPIVLIALTGRYPHFQPYPARIASSVASQPTQLLKCGERRIARWKSERHETVARFGAAPESCFGATQNQTGTRPEAGRGLIPTSSRRWNSPSNLTCG